MSKVKIELVTSNDVAEFSELCKTIDEDVYIKGIDEFGKEWIMNAKSVLGTLAITAVIEEKNKEKTRQLSIVDWNTIYAESDYPHLYTLLSKFAR